MDNTQENKENQKNKKEHSNIKWFIQVFIMTFILSMIFSYISANGVSHLNLISAILILILVIAIGIFFDIIGVAVTVANEHEFHAKATKRVKGSKDSIKLIRNAPKVANICADVIGDICRCIKWSNQCFNSDENWRTIQIKYGLTILTKCFSSSFNSRRKGSRKRNCQ